MASPIRANALQTQLRACANIRGVLVPNLAMRAKVVPFKDLNI